MPELPEVETVMRGLARAIKGRRIIKVEQKRKDLRIPFPRDIQSIAGTKVRDLSRRAKYILLHLSDGRDLVIHLGMSGRMTINPAAPDKHDHFILTFDDGTTTVFNDARRFGLVALMPAAGRDAHKLFAHLGPEPFDKAFSAGYLRGMLEGRKSDIKTALMDQRLVVGVGNIYAAEALYLARISPLRKSGSLNAAEAARLVKAVRQVLDKAIAAGGSSLRDYVQADGELGYFQHKWAVYGKEGAACPRRGCDGLIRRTVQGGRSTFYCPDCQK